MSMIEYMILRTIVLSSSEKYWKNVRSRCNKYASKKATDAPPLRIISWPNAKNSIVILSDGDEHQETWISILMMNEMCSTERNDLPQAVWKVRQFNDYAKWERKQRNDN